MTAPYLPYSQPPITTILSLIAFILLLNGIRRALDHVLYCGILGEILLGVIWGEPLAGTALLPQGLQEDIQTLGYLGLIALVFQGGLLTSPAALCKAAWMSVFVATIGLVGPIALSFLLLCFPFSAADEEGRSTGPARVSPIAAFSAGAALCSTSLGTTLSILSAAGLGGRRVGVVLIGAAMMDDVVGLIMVNIVTVLGKGEGGGWEVARPVVASFGMLVATVASTAMVFGPMVQRGARWLYSCGPEGGTDGHVIRKAIVSGKRFLKDIPHLPFIFSILILIVFLTIASYISASLLLAAFLAGSFVDYTWPVARPSPSLSTSPPAAVSTPPAQMYETYYAPVADYLLTPFFFASIGFAIPIRGMFAGPVVWKGLIYTLLMVIGKALVGLAVYFEYFVARYMFSKGNTLAPVATSRPGTGMKKLHTPALLLSCAMVARGEIGFLIASLASSSGTLSPQSDKMGSVSSIGEDFFLVLIWAVVLCTLIGPIGVGMIVRRIRKKQQAGQRDERDGSLTNVLESWG